MKWVYSKETTDKIIKMKIKYERLKLANMTGDMSFCKEDD